MRSILREVLKSHIFYNRSGREIWKKPAFVSMTAVLLAGCSTHPLQQDVTGVPTSVLVEYIRCETRLAIQDKAIDLLVHEKPDNPLISQLKTGRSFPWPPGLRAHMNAHERAVYDQYIKTGIAYDFSLDITEDNTASGAVDPVRLITNGTVGIGLSASGDFKRENLRHFVVSETAQDLLENDKLPCGPNYKSSNYTYPIAGKIGIDELISTFFDLNDVNNLAPDKTTSSVFADTLTFTTTIMGSVSPNVVVTPTGRRWGLASPTNLTASGSRIDKHALIIALSLDTPKGAVKSTAGGTVVPGYAGGRSALQRNHVRSGTEQSALDALIQARLDAYLDRAFQ